MATRPLRTKSLGELHFCHHFFYCGLTTIVAKQKIKIINGETQKLTTFSISQTRVNKVIWFTLTGQKSVHLFCLTSPTQISKNKDSIWKQKLWKEKKLQITISYHRVASEASSTDLPRGSPPQSTVTQENQTNSPSYLEGVKSRQAGNHLSDASQKSHPVTSRWQQHTLSARSPLVLWRGPSGRAPIPPASDQGPHHGGGQHAPRAAAVLREWVVGSLARLPLQGNPVLLGGATPKADRSGQFLPPSPWSSTHRHIPVFC